MRICRILPLAALIIAMPLGGVAQTLSPPASGWLELFHECEIDWLYSKPESPTGGFEPWLGPKQVPRVAPGLVRPCLSYTIRNRRISSTYLSGRTPTPTGDFWRRGEFERLIGRR
jgi:hypothetical protein